MGPLVHSACPRVSRPCLHGAGSTDTAGMARRSDSPPSSQNPPHSASASGPMSRLKAVFTRPLLGRRDDDGPSVAPDAQADRSGHADKAAAPHADQRALQMHAALRKALDAAPNSRKVFRHLATVEHHLWRKGSLFLHDLSLPALHRILEQLDGVATAPLAPGLAALRASLVDTIAAQERLQRHNEMLQPRSSFFVDHKMEVREASVSDFDRALGERS